MNPSIPAAVYRRVSTDHQDNSLVVQESINDEYAKRFSLALNIDIEFADNDTSGSIAMRDRDGGRALMNRLKHGDIKHFITSKQDRIGRDTLDIIATVRAIWELGITPHFTCEGGAFPRTPQNELLMEIKASVAQYERNIIRERVRISAQHKFVRFELTGNVPFGYDCEYTFADGHTHVSPRALRFKTTRIRDEANDANGKKAFIDAAPEAEATQLITMHGALLRNRLIDNEGEQAVIRRMAVMRQSMSLKAIADTLNAQGITTKLGRPWQCGSVNGVLTSRHTARLLADNKADGETGQLAA